MAEERLGASFDIDVTNLKAGLTQANRLIRESESQFKAAAAGMDDWTQSEEGLNAKIKSLTDITEIQKKKVAALKTEYENLINEGLDPTSKQAVDLRTKINNEEAALASNEKELNKQTAALEDVGKESEKAGKAAKNSGDEAEKGGKGWAKFGDIAKKAAKAAAAAIAAAGAAVIGITKQAIESYAEYEQLVGGVDTLFGQSSQKVQQYAANAYKTAGMSANEYMETVTGFSASLLQSLGGDTDKAASYADMAIRDMSDNANKMGDMESIKNAYGGFAKGNFDMLDNLKLGYGGTREEMERLLSDASKISGVKYDVSSYGDIVDAIHVVQNEMGITGTTAKEASTTIQGSISSMKSAWSNLLTGLADDTQDIDMLITNLIDSISTVAENLLPRIAIVVKGIIKLIEKLVPQIPPLIADMLPELITAAMSLIEGLVSVFPKLIQTIVDVIPQILKALLAMLPTILQAAIDIIVSVTDGIAKMLPEIVNTVIAIIPQLIDSLIAAIPKLLNAAIQLLMAIVQAIPVIITNLLASLPNIVETIINGLLAAIPQLILAAIQLFNAILEAIPVIITALVENLPTIINTIIDGILNALPLLLQASIQLFMAIIKALPTIITLLVKEVPKIVKTISSTLLSRLPELIKGAVELFMGIIKAIPKIIVEIAKNMPQIIKAIVSGLKAGIKDVANVGADLVKGLWNGIKDMVGWIKEKIKSFGKSVLNGLKEFFGIHSPSTVMENVIGKNLALGIGEGFENNIGAVNKQITDAMNFDDPSITVNGASKRNAGVTIYQTNNYSQAHSRLELYKSKQQTAAAVRLAIAGV